MSDRTVTSTGSENGPSPATPAEPAVPDVPAAPPPWIGGTQPSSWS